jgi:hypothetical protein
MILTEDGKSVSEFESSLIEITRTKAKKRD